MQYASTQQGAWKGDTAGGCMNFPETAKMNPMFHLLLSERTDCQITLKQVGEPLTAIGFIVAHKGGSRIDVLYKDETVAKSGQYRSEESVGIQVTLPPRDTPYTILVSTFDPGVEKPFALTISSDKKVKFSACPAHGTMAKMDSKSSAFAKSSFFGGPFLASCLHKPPTKPSKAYTDIVAHLKKTGEKFVDGEFPPQRGWERLSEMEVKGLPDGRTPHICLFDSIDPDDIVQGGLGDCWFLSAMSAMAGRDRAILSLYVKSEYSEQCLYAILFYTSRGWEEVIVDDYVPMERGRPKYCMSDESHEMWPSIMEKAYAKLHRGYDNIKGGQACDAFVNLTGGVGDIQELNPRTQADRDAMWAQLQDWHKRKYMIAAGTRPGSDLYSNPRGIVDGHAYSILQVKDYKDVRLIHMRNPHGCKEWNGAWSDKDTTHWDKKAKKAMNHKDADDGEFWIAFNDFLRNYETLYICKVFPKGSWKECKSRGFWTGRERDAVDCPQFLLKVTSKTHVVISLRQDETRGTTSETVYINFDLVRNEGKRVERMTTDLDHVMDMGSFANSTEKSWEGDVEAYDHPYTLVCRNFKYKGANQFTLRIFSEHSVSLRTSEQKAPREAPDASVLKQGWGTKRGHVIKNWKRRWFMLKGNFLYYRVNEDGGTSLEEVENTKRGKIDLTEAKLSRNLPPVDGHAHLVHVIEPKKTYIISFDTETDQRLWAAALDRAIFRARQATD